MGVYDSVWLVKPPSALTAIKGIQVNILAADRQCIHNLDSIRRYLVLAFELDTFAELLYIYIYINVTCCVGRVESRDTNRNIKRSVYCQYG